MGTLLYKKEEGQRSWEVMAAAVQASIQGYFLWNNFYTSILQMKIPERAFLVIYADDVVVIILVCNTEIPNINLNHLMSHVNRWKSMDSHCQLPKQRLQCSPKTKYPSFELER